jgi:hypothetical protein
MRRLLDAELVSVAGVRERGYTNNRRWVVRAADGRSAFVKQATDEATAGWLRTEHLVYLAIALPWAARALGLPPPA